MAETETKKPRHRVLYMKGNGFDRFHPLASRAVDDPGAEDDFASLKSEHLTRARHAGAVRPEFKIVTEEEGKEVANG